jgi:ABC-2 type transport system permease protein
MIIWVLTATLPLIMLALWEAVARQGPVSGFGEAEFARYYTLTLVARQLTSSWVVWELNQDIRTGALSPSLLRPINPLWLHAVRNLAVMPLRLVVLVPLVGALLLWRPDMHIPLDAWRVAAFLWSSFVAWALAFAFQAAFGCLAFWFDQSLGLYNAWFGAWSLMGGYLIPVRLLPPWLGAAAKWLPFRGMLGLPVEIGSGLVPRGAVVGQLALQLAWLAVSVGLLVVVWRRGVRRYGAFGA